MIDSHQYLPHPPVKEDFGITVSMPFSSRVDVDLTEKEVKEGTLVLKLEVKTVIGFLLSFGSSHSSCLPLLHISFQILHYFQRFSCFIT